MKGDYLEWKGGTFRAVNTVYDARRHTCFPQFRHLLPLAMFLFLAALLCLLAKPAKAMTLAEYAARYQDTNVSYTKDSISFYGVKIYQGGSVDSGNMFGDLIPAYAVDYKEHKIIAPGTPDNTEYDSNFVIYDDEDTQNPFSKSASIAKNFPEPGMVTLAVQMDPPSTRTTSVLAIFTISNKKLYYALADYHGYIDVKNCMLEKYGIIKGVNAFWDVYAFKEGCPCMSFGCPGCMASAVHILAFKKNKWSYCKPGEYRDAYKIISSEAEANIKAYLRDNNLTVQQCTKQGDTSYGMYVCEFAYACIMEDLNTSQYVKRLHPYMTKKCAKVLLKSLSKSAQQVLKEQPKNSVY